MPQYITRADLLAAAGATRLAQAATPDDAPVLAADTLRQALASEDLTAYAYDPATIAAAAEAVSWIDAAIDRAEGDLDAACRDRYALPLDSVDAGTRGMLLDLALAYSYRQGRPKEAEDARAAAEARLARVGRGDLRLAASAPSAAPSAGSPEYSSTDPVLDPSSMGVGGAGWPSGGW
jgi:hypothetical protein